MRSFLCLQHFDKFSIWSDIMRNHLPFPKLKVMSERFFFVKLTRSFFIPARPPDPRWRPNHCIPQVFPKYSPSIPQVFPKYSSSIPQVFLTWLEFLDDEAPRPEVEAEPLRPLEFRLSLRSPKFKLTSLWVNEFDIDVEVLLALAELLLQLLEASTSPESLLRLTGLLPAKKNREIVAIFLMLATFWQIFQYEKMHAMTENGHWNNILTSSTVWHF